MVALIVGAVIFLTGEGSDTERASPTTVASAPTVSVARSVVDRAPTTSAPSTTSTTVIDEAASEGPIRLPGVDDPHGAADIVQQLATALAHGEWDDARRVQPTSTQSDAGYAAGYRGLEESTVVVTDVTADSTRLTGAYVAWETADGLDRTSIYCMTWTVDPTGRTLSDARNSGAEERFDGWIDPATLTDRVDELCR